jgi:U4/U6.U5 tri-snRNP-associated protein 3
VAGQTPAAPEEIDSDEELRMMGLPVGFGSSKGKLIKGNEQGGVFIKTKRQFRQYMNRKGGFNRPLDNVQ